MKNLLVATLLFTLSACSSIPLVNPESPSVSVTGVRAVKIGLVKQTIGLTLRIENPNGFELPMQSLSFNAKFSGQRFAQGRSVNNVIIPANGDAEIEVEITAGLSKLADQLKAMIHTDNPELNYDVTGLVKLANWPTAIPFNIDGEIEDPRIAKDE